MADFLGSNKDEEEEATSTFKIGDKEYSQDELNELVELGTFAKEVETKQNTKLDKLYPEYTKKSQKLKEMESKVEEYREKMEELSRAKEDQGGELTPEQIQEARKAGRKIGFLTEDAMEEHFSKAFRRAYLQERQAEKLLENCDKLAGEIDGSDGRPAFKTEDILQHMQDTGLKDPERAYKDMYESELDQWRSSKLGSAKKPGLTTIEESTAGSKQPKPVKVTANNLDDMVREALRGQ